MRVYLCAIICSWLFLCSAGAGISDEVVLALAPFDFIDTSGETRSQVAEHKHRLELFHATVEAAVSALSTRSDSAIAL